MSTFENRQKLTAVIEDNIDKLFPNDAIREYGCASLAEDEVFSEFLRSPEINQMHAGMILKFAPDFVLLKKSKPQNIYFVDVKHSVSPIWSFKHYRQLLQRSIIKNKTTIEISDIGVVAREALLAYRRYYPNTIIIMASPYNEKVLMAQFASEAKCFYCYTSGTNSGVDCARCPQKTGEFFEIERAKKSMGSQTPMTNVDLSSFEPIGSFFQKLGIDINNTIADEIVNSIKHEPLDFSSAPSEQHINHIKWELNRNGCGWIDYTIFTRENNDFFHIQQDCRGLRKGTGHVVETQALTIKERRKRLCKFC